jgi:ferredoxin-NADP reductase
MIELVVTDRRVLADDVVGLTLATVDGTPVPEWDPGAHVDLSLGNGLQRQYSLCGDPADRSAWQVAVLREPAGRGGSDYVHTGLTVGGKVSARGPRNHFPLHPAPSYRFIAGGIGITPILAMVEAAERAGADWRLLYGGRRRASMAFLDRLAGYGDRVEVRPQDEYGLLDLAAAIDGAPPGTLVYCCGPEPLLSAVEQRCPPGVLHTERFTALPAAPGEAFEVVLGGSGRTFTIEAGRSILETLEDGGVNVLFSCREGTCGTCETGVLDGEPDHRDVLLTDAERAVGDVMMICVSRCRGARLVLDL